MAINSIYKNPDTILFPASFNEEAFTLVELLIVITIIAIISVIAVASYSGVSSNARDGKRKAEIETLSHVMEVNKTPDGGGYNPVAAFMFGGGVFPGTNNIEALDPSGYPYCIATSTTVTPPANMPEDLSGVVGWDNTAGTTSCPPGWDKFTGTEPQSTSFAWTVCARLEESNIPKAFCRTSVQ